jgi:hypothetical protein
MTKTPSRFKQHHASEGAVENGSAAVEAVESEPLTASSRGSHAAKLLSVEARHPARAGQPAEQTVGVSGVYIVEREEDAAHPEGDPRRTRKMNPLLEQVTLVVYGWHNVEPGTLAWVFPSVGAAVSAARAMKNAVRWAIVAGRREASDADLVDARAHGAVLIEELG